MFSLTEIVVTGFVAAGLTGLALAAWPWARRRGRFAVGAVSTLVGWMGWNLVLNATNGANFNVDAPLVGLSWADAGSGILAFTATALALGLLLDRVEPAGRVVGAAAIAGLVAMLVDLFVL